MLTGCRARFTSTVRKPCIPSTGANCEAHCRTPQPSNDQCWSRNDTSLQHRRHETRSSDRDRRGHRTLGPGGNAYAQGNRGGELGAELNWWPVRNNLWMLVGAGSNITASVGPDGVFLVNAGEAQATERVLTALDDLQAQLNAFGVLEGPHTGKGRCGDALEAPRKHARAGQADPLHRQYEPAPAQRRRQRGTGGERHHLLGRKRRGNDRRFVRGRRRSGPRERARQNGRRTTALWSVADRHILYRRVQAQHVSSTTKASVSSTFRQRRPTATASCTSAVPT